MWRMRLREAKVKPKACLYIISKEVTKQPPEKEMPICKLLTNFSQLFPPILSYIGSLCVTMMWQDRDICHKKRHYHC